LNRRSMVKLGLAAAGAPVLSQMIGQAALAQEIDLGPGGKHVGDIGGRNAKRLFPGETLRSGGQMEIRLNQSIHTDDPDELEVAQRLTPFDPQSWYDEW